MFFAVAAGSVVAIVIGVVGVGSVVVVVVVVVVVGVGGVVRADVVVGGLPLVVPETDISYTAYSLSSKSGHTSRLGYWASGAAGLSSVCGIRYPYPASMPLRLASVRSVCASVILLDAPVRVSGAD